MGVEVDVRSRRWRSKDELAFAVLIDHELLFGPVYHRLMFSGRPLDEGLAERVVDAVLPAVAAR